jgi:hypothetical protein
MYRLTFTVCLCSLGRDHTHHPAGEAFAQLVL